RRPRVRHRVAGARPRDRRARSHLSGHLAMTPPSNVASARAAADLPALGRQMHALVAELYPLCRSITGEGLRATLRRVARDTGLQIREVPTGTPVLDWTVPREWNIRDAWVANARGERVIDFRKSNLHVVNYSVPVRARMTLAELRPRLH